MAIKDQLAEIVGKDNVLDSPDIIARYGSDHSLQHPGLFTCVVRPKTVAETQKVIQLANEVKFAVVPQSSGVHFNGGAVPKQGGVVLDVSQMNRIVEVVDAPMVAHCQVGVTWEQLQTALEAKGYRSIIPLLPHASRSVIMDWLERERPVVQHYEMAYPLRSLQMIWGNGELYVTGSAMIGHFRQPGVLADGIMAANISAMSQDTQLYGAQGTYAVVTWGVCSFEEIPTLTKTFFIPASRVEDLIEPSYRILRAGVSDEYLLLNNTTLATILTENWPEQFAQLRATLPPWMAIFISSALKRHPEEKMAYQEEFVDDLISSIYFSKLEVLTTLPGLPAVERRLPEMLRKPWPKDRIYWKHAYKGGCQDLIFTTTPEGVDRYISPVVEIATRHQYPAGDIGCYIQPIQDGRACDITFSFYYNPKDEAEMERIRALYREAAAACLDRGAYFTRPYPMVADMVYGRAGQYAVLLKRFKRNYDPNGILSPGNLCF